MQTKTDTKEPSKTTLKTEKEKLHLKMEIFTKENSQMILCKEQDNIYGNPKTFMKESSETTSQTDLEKYYTKQVQLAKDYGMKDKQIKQNIRQQQSNYILIILIYNELDYCLLQ